MTGTSFDQRFAGYSNEQLAVEIDAMRAGQGSESFYQAVDALKSISTTLAETDRTLREQLASIGVEWESDTADAAKVTLTDSATYGADADQTMTTSAQAVNNQGDVFSHTKGSAPNTTDLRGDTRATGTDTAAGYFGHETDHAKEVRRTNESRAQAVSALDGYSSASQQNLNQYQSLPVPPSLNLNSKPIDQGQGGTTVQGLTGNPAAYTPHGGPAGPGFVAPNAPGGGGPGLNATPFPGLDAGPGNPGGGNPLPGKQMGINPFPGGGGGPLAPTGGGLPPALRGPLAFGNEAALAAGLGGAGGGAAVGANLEQDKVVRSGRPNTMVGRPGASTMSSGVPAEEATAARNAERLAPRGRAAAPMMQPATGTAEGDEDGSHVRKYAVESDDVFGDDRMVIQSVLGEDD